MIALVPRLAYHPIGSGSGAWECGLQQQQRDRLVHLAIKVWARSSGNDDRRKNSLRKGKGISMTATQFQTGNSSYQMPSPDLGLRPASFFPSPSMLSVLVPVAYFVPTSEYVLQHRTEKGGGETRASHMRKRPISP